MTYVLRTLCSHGLSQIWCAIEAKKVTVVSKRSKICRWINNRLLPVGKPRMMPVLSGLGVAGLGSTATSRKNNVNRPKKKLTRLSKGLDPQVYRNLWFPQQSVLQASKTANLVIPKIVIDKADEDTEATTWETFKRREMNSGLLHPSYAICSAVSADDPSALKNIILSGAADVNQLNSSGASALHDAAFEGKLRCVDILVQFGADVDLRDREGWNPLHAAVCGGNKPCAAYLVKHGADARARNDDGVTPIHIAVGRRDKEMIKILTSAYEQNDSYYRQTREFQSTPALTLRVANYGRV